MPKAKKSSKRQGNVPNKILYSRVSYLYQAATFLALQSQHSQNTQLTNEDEFSAEKGNEMESYLYLNSISRRLISDFRDVSLKAQIRVSPFMKRSICKCCFTILIDGQTCNNVIENKSKESRKPWADVLVKACRTCGAVKRFPLVAQRQPRRSLRLQEKLSSSNDK